MAGRRRSELRWGFSTGTAAAAATGAALLALAGQPRPAVLTVPLPHGGHLDIPIHSQALQGEWGVASVIKDAGDDPDVTHGAEIGVRLRRLPGISSEDEVVFLAGPGVGTVTKPGLVLPVGEPAINPVPRRMIRTMLEQLRRRYFPAPQRWLVEVFIPRGEELARRTLNPRLGIRGGLSILGTTGLVKPFSHQAYRATIALALKVARAQGLGEVVLITGSRSETLARQWLPTLPEEAFVQMGDYVRFTVRLAARLGFSRLTVAVFPGKALKIAQGLPQTHASQGPVDLPQLAAWTLNLTGRPGLAAAVAQANTAQQAFAYLATAAATPVLAYLAQAIFRQLRSYATRPVTLRLLLWAGDGQLLWEQEEAA